MPRPPDAQSDLPAAAGRVRLLFAAVVVGFVVQLGFVVGVEEPYPALILPGFGRPPTTDGAVELERAEILVRFRDGSTARTTPARLFANAPGSFLGALTFHFRPPGDRPARDLAPGGPDGRRPGARIAERIPGLALRSARRTASTVSPEMRRWLQRRLADLYPDRRATAARFVWYRDRYHLERDGEHQRERYGEFRVELDHASNR